MNRSTRVALAAIVAGTIAVLVAVRETTPEPSADAAMAVATGRSRTTVDAVPTSGPSAPGPGGLVGSAPTGRASAMTLAWHSGAALRPLVDARIACARAGDRECQYDIYLAFKACEFNTSRKDVADPETLERTLADLGRRGERPEHVALEKIRFRACFGIGPDLARQIDAPREWLVRAYAAGHPAALMVAANEVALLAMQPHDELERAIAPRDRDAQRTDASASPFEPVGEHMVEFKVPSAFLPSGTRDPDALRRHALDLATAAVLSGRPEVLLEASELRDSIYLIDGPTPLDTAAWILLACDAGYPCEASSIVSRQVCMMMGCREPSNLFDTLTTRQGPGFVAQVQQCSQRIAAALARGDGAAALAERCR